MSAADRPARASGAAARSSDADRDRLDASAFAAAATFAAAHQTAVAIAARRRGEHPSEMRDRATVRADAHAVASDLRDLLRHFTRLLLMGMEDDENGRIFIRRTRLAGVLLAAQRLARAFHTLHQHLLGLYDGTDAGDGDVDGMAHGSIDAVLLEDVRRFAARADAFFDGSTLLDEEEVFAFTDTGVSIAARAAGATA